MLLLYFVWKYYKELADKYNKEKAWSYILLGAVVYYAGTFIGGVLIGLIALSADMDIEDTNDRLLGLMALPVGILFSYLLYKYLEKKWKSEYVDPELALDELGADNDAEPPLIR
jgi:hypothetical protein